ncbi:MAG: hypothetical protein K2H43_06815, partial [Clostridia bacterium]|nr:hypothetical protein [Clostridia bacterium]
YTVVVHLNKNYCWAGESGDAAAEDVTLPYTLKQKPFQGHMGSWQSGDDFTWDDNTFTYIPENSEQDVPEITMAGLAGGAQAITFELELWQLIEGEKVIVGNGTGKPTTSGTYYYKLTGWTGMTSGEHDSAYDFTFPSNEFIVEFTINSAALKAPVVDSSLLTIVYDGTEHQFTSCIGNWSISQNGFQFTYGANGTDSKVYVFVQSAAGNLGEAVSGNLAAMTDAGAYTVYIYPKNNFKWEDGVGAVPITVNGKEYKGFSYTFTITPRTLEASDFKWFADDDNTYANELDGGDYNGYVYNNVNRGLLVIANVESRDGAVTVEYSYNAAERKNAGTQYTATVDGLTEGSGNWFNYTVASGITKSFTIQRLGIAKPTVSAESNAFDGKEHAAVFGLPTISVTDLNWNQVASAAVTGVYGFKGAGNASNGMTNQSVYLSSGFFRYTNAGTYTVTFTITDTTNYYWIDGENQDEDCTVSFTIARMEITAPSLGEQSGGQYLSDRTMRYDGAEKYPKLDRDSAYTLLNDGSLAYTADGHTVTFSVLYGLYNTGFEEITASVSPINYNKYYVQLKITSGNPLNYLLVQNDADIRSDSTNMGVFEQNGYVWGDVSYTAGGVSVYLAYMITKQILDVDFSLLGNQSFYTFGHNGLANKVQKEDFIKLTQGVDLETVQKDVDDGKATVSEAFYSVDSLDVLIADGVNAEKRIDPADLVNGLPWDAGIYGVRVEIGFTDVNAQYEPIVRWYTFEVKKLEMSVTWSAGDDGAVTGGGTEFTAVYDGQSHTLAAKIGNAPKKDADDEPELPVLAVSGGDRTNANESGYTLSVTGTYDNYTVTGGENTSATLVIERRTVTVNVKTDKVTHVYNGGVAYPDNYYTYASTDTETHFVETDKKYITYILCAADDVNHTPIQTYRVGTYRLVPVLDPTVAGSANYKLGDCGAGTLEIVAREIEVTVLATAKSDYQRQKVTLTEGIVYQVTLKNSSDENWLVSGDTDVFTVSSAAASKEWQEAGDYPLILTRGANTDYAVRVNGKLVENVGDAEEIGLYAIEKVALQDVRAAGVPNVVYNGADRSWIGDLIDANATAQNQTVNKIVWKYVLKSGAYASAAPDTDSTVWAEFSGSAHDAFASKDYWVMATAPNHLNAAPISVTVSIAKEQLSVTVNFTGDHALYYGQEKPDASVTVTDGKLPVNSIYTVSGFKGNDESVWKADGTIAGLTGTFSYQTSMQGGNKNPVGTDYTTAFVSGTLESTNYTFAPTAAGGALTVEKLPVTVTIESRSKAYMYMTETGFEVEDESVLQNCFSIASKVNGIAVPDVKTDILSLKTDALVINGGRITATADAGKYALYAVSNGAYENYDCTFVITGEAWSGANPDDNGVVGRAGIFEITGTAN